MTTIVYCHKTKQIACDSRSTAGITICSDETEKFLRHKDEMWFFAGSVAEIDVLISMHENKTKPRYLSTHAIVVSQRGVFGRGYCSEERNYLPYKIDHSWAVGSGTDHALTALDMGATAKQAVEMAMKRDCKSGGKIWVFDCVTMEFVE